MKILAIDVGNSEVKRAIIEDGVVGTVQRDATRDIDDYVAEIAAQELPVVLCSVRSVVSTKIKAALAKEKKKLALEIDSVVNEPVSGFYEGIGADRIADVSAAWLDFDGKRPVAVIGLGTATTITASSRSGKFKGGFITLGLGSVCATLSNALPELPAIDPRQAKTLEPAYDTYSSMCRGTVAAHIGTIEEWITLFRRQIGDDLAIVATGGWCEFIAPFCFCFDKVDPLLTLRGIWTVFQHANAQELSGVKSDSSLLQ